MPHGGDLLQPDTMGLPAIVLSGRCKAQPAACGFARACDGTLLSRKRLKIDPSAVACPAAYNATEESQPLPMRNPSCPD